MALIMNVLIRLSVVPNMPILRKIPYFFGVVFFIGVYWPTGMRQYGTLAIFH
jgi:hypothetical protein